MALRLLNSWWGVALGPNRVDVEAEDDEDGGGQRVATALRAAKRPRSIQQFAGFGDADSSDTEEDDEADVDQTRRWPLGKAIEAARPRPWVWVVPAIEPGALVVTEAFPSASASAQQSRRQLQRPPALTLPGAPAQQPLSAQQQQCCLPPQSPTPPHHSPQKLTRSGVSDDDSGASSSSRLNGPDDMALSPSVIKATPPPKDGAAVAGQRDAASPGGSRSMADALSDDDADFCSPVSALHSPASGAPPELATSSGRPSPAGGMMCAALTAACSGLVSAPLLAGHREQPQPRPCPFGVALAEQHEAHAAGAFMRLQPHDVAAAAGSGQAGVPPFVGAVEEANSGFRSYMEDRMAAADVGGAVFLGVYDGHGGADASTFLQAHLFRAIAERLTPGADVASAMASAFAATNAAFRDTGSSQGSTATAVVLHGTQLIAANVGDSPAFVVTRSGHVYCCFEEHKIEGAELARVAGHGVPILKNPSGGPTYMGTLDGSRWLNMSRAFGDFVYPAVLCEPYCCSLDVSDAQYLVLGSDGLTERWPLAEVARCVADLAAEGGHGGPAGIARMLVHRALARGSTDNVSAVVVDLEAYLQQQQQQQVAAQPQPQPQAAPSRSSGGGGAQRAFGAFGPAAAFSSATAYGGFADSRVCVSERSWAQPPAQAAAAAAAAGAATEPPSPSSQSLTPLLAGSPGMCPSSPRSGSASGSGEEGGQADPAAVLTAAVAAAAQQQAAESDADDLEELFSPLSGDDHAPCPLLSEAADTAAATADADAAAPSPRPVAAVPAPAPAALMPSPQSLLMARQAQQLAAQEDCSRESSPRKRGRDEAEGREPSLLQREEGLSEGASSSGDISMRDAA